MSETCCSEAKNSLSVKCPVNRVAGRRVKNVTLKSLLKPEALALLNSASNYFFCDSTDCPVVYFHEQGQTFLSKDLKIPVYQKDNSLQVPVCYCFDWTRERILQEIQQTNHHTPESSRTYVPNHVFPSLRP